MRLKRIFMENSEKLQQEAKISTEEYNNIPVHYCKKCLSLKIFVFDKDTDYCGDCGSADIDTAHIDEVLSMKNNKN